jgi:hypothetical protein
VRVPMWCYLIGLVLCGLAFNAAHRTQLHLYNEAVNPPRPPGPSPVMAWYKRSSCYR